MLLLLLLFVGTMGINLNTRSTADKKDKKERGRLVTLELKGCRLGISEKYMPQMRMFIATICERWRMY